MDQAEQALQRAERRLEDERATMRQEEHNSVVEALGKRMTEVNEREAELRRNEQVIPIPSLPVLHVQVIKFSRESSRRKFAI